MEKAVYQLKISADFQNLVQPIRRPALRRLVQNMEDHGCNEPFSVWRMCLLEDFDRYETCQRLQIPFTFREYDFPCREAAIVWVCASQLSRKDLTEEWQKYLIGIQYGAERIAIAQKTQPNLDLNLDIMDEVELLSNEGAPAMLPSGRAIATRIGEVNHISWNTVIKYAEYARMIDAVRRTHPPIANHILLGNLKVSHDMVMTLSKMSAVQLEDVYQRLKTSGHGQSKNKNMRAIIAGGAAAPAKERRVYGPSVKDMPSYDPDAEITALTYTIPSWDDSIRRVCEKVDFVTVTVPAKRKLAEALGRLMQEIRLLLEKVRDEE